MKVKNKIIQLTSFLLVVLILMPSISILFLPKKTYAILVPTECLTTGGLPCASEPTSWLVKFFTAATSFSTAASAGFNAKQWARYLVEQILRAFARRLLAQMTQSTVNWINSGFHGAPLFLERPESFFKDIAKFEIRNLINTIGYDSNRFPFGKAFALNVIQSYKSTFESNAQYSLSKVINDPVLLNNFRNDFSVGGWNGFLINTQYPQNNYLGYQIVASNELARVLANNPVNNNISKVQDTLQKGMGFLSPQTCPSNPKYNNLKNEFQRPSPPRVPTIRCEPPKPGEPGKVTPEQSKCFEDATQANTDYQKKYLEWAEKNDCPGGLVTTTPGSVVANQIMKALTSSTFDQTSLAAAMGNSLSAIFDALLNKFLSSGLNALTSRKSSPPPVDDFNYFGQTFGSPSGSTGGTGSSDGDLDWGGPDQVVVLADLKKNVQNLLDNANKELKLIDNNDPTTPGILQLFNKIFSKTQELDMCLPGPNRGWEERTDGETQKNAKKLKEKMFSDNEARIKAATEALNELTFATDAFKKWLENKIKTELPSSADYLNTVADSVEKTSQQIEELNGRKNVITGTLTKLESIKAELDAITTEPVRDSEEEKTVVRLRQRIEGMILDISNTTTVNEMRNKLDDGKDKLTDLEKLLTKCETERRAKGWSVPGGEASLFSAKTEKEVFCGLPIAGGYSHKSFINTGAVTHPEIPLVNAEEVYPGPDMPPIFRILEKPVDMEISCEAVYKTSITDYERPTPSF